MTTLHRPHLDRLAHVLHASRCLRDDGTPIGAHLCYCLDDVEALWPEIDGLRDDAFEEGIACHRQSVLAAQAELSQAFGKLGMEVLDTLTFWRKK